MPSMEPSFHFGGVNIAEAGTPFGHELFVQCLLADIYYAPFTVARLLSEKQREFSGN